MKNKGITLIALIITIVVMLILVTVTLLIAFGENGVIGIAQESKKEQEAAAFKECVRIATVGNYDPNYDWQANLNAMGKYDLISIKNEISSKYPDANFTFYIDNMTGAATGASDDDIVFFEASVYCAQKTLDYIEGRNFPDDKITTAQKNDIQNALDRAKEEFVEMEHERNPDSNLTVEEITIRLNTSMYEGTIKDGLRTNIAIYGLRSSMIAEYKGTVVPIGFINSNMYEYCNVMDLSKAMKLFEFTWDVDNGDLYYNGAISATIKSYKGNSSTVKVPGTLVVDDPTLLAGTVLENAQQDDAIIVTGIEDYAFCHRYVNPLVTELINLTDDNYNGTSTLADFKTDITNDLGSTSDYICAHNEGDQCTKKSCKNEALKKILVILANNDLEMQMTETKLNSYISFDSEENMHIYIYQNLDGQSLPVTETEYKDSNIKTIIVSEGIMEIGDGAFINCYNLKEIYLPSTIISINRIGEDIFSLCSSLTTLKTMNNDIAESTEKWGCPNDIEKIYIEQTAEM